LIFLFISGVKDRLKKELSLVLEKLQPINYLWRSVLAAIFISAGVLKLLSPEQMFFPTGSQFLPETIARLAGLLLPWLEILLGLWLITGFFKRTALGAALFLILVFISTNMYGLISGDSQTCNCLGSAISLTHGQSLALDILMLAMAILALVSKKSSPKNSLSSIIRQRLWPAFGAAALTAIVLISFLPGAALKAGQAGSSPLHPPMRPSAQKLTVWEEDYRNAPLYQTPINPASGLIGESIPTSYSLLDLLDYVPAERDQGYVGNCWVWAGTGVMEIAMTVSTGVKDRLSIQYLDSNYYYNGDRAGCGGELAYFASFYNGDPAYNTAAVRHIAVPWANSGADYQDYYLGVCNTYSGAPVSTTPNYPILSSITPLTIPTTGVSQSRAIANIKSALLNQQAVFFGFYLPLSGSYSTFYDFSDFWNYENGTSSVWVPDMACGQTWPDYGGHAVVCVGYDDSNNSWIMLNSWGTTADRPDGTFRLTQDLNYNCTFSYGPETNVTTFQWQTLNTIFTSTIPSVTTLEASQISSNRATLNANLNELGSSSAVSVSFEYGDSVSYGLNTPAQIMTAPGRFKARISNLTPGTTYHFRAKAVGTQTVYGSDMTFTTLAVPPVPVSSGLSIGLTIAGLAAVITFRLLRRRRLQPR
jgi:uncharacterized membrane protein YphA (DoxX/SURF4 family)